MESNIGDKIGDNTNKKVDTNLFRKLSDIMSGLNNKKKKKK